MKECLLALGSSLVMIFWAPRQSCTVTGTLLKEDNAYLRVVNEGRAYIQAVNEDSTYIRVITERAGKIVAKLGLPDSAAFFRVRGMVANQYKVLNDVYADRDSKLKALKERQPAPDKATVDSVKKMIQQDVDARVGQLHSAYLATLGTVLTPQQITEVKDGMTYSVLEVTYRGYLEELPNLTDQQKAVILADLTEAREHAMDAGSSKEKHAWFGKYKGRINNYLSSQGIDMKKAQAEWQQRLKEKQAAAPGNAKSK